jgi:hypothetical protein
MTASVIAALINARVACAMIRLEACKAANTQRASQGLAPAYGEAEILAIIEEEGIYHNAVHSMREWVDE